MRDKCIFNFHYFCFHKTLTLDSEGTRRWRRLCGNGELSQIESLRLFLIWSLLRIGDNSVRLSMSFAESKSRCIESDSWSSNRSVISEFLCSMWVRLRSARSVGSLSDGGIGGDDDGKCWSKSALWLMLSGSTRPFTFEKKMICITKIIWLNI